MINASDYHIILENAGLPIVGVSLRDNTASVNGWATPPTPEQEAEAAALLLAARPLELTTNRATIPPDGVTAATVTVKTAPDVASVSLDIRGVVAVVACSAGVGTQDITSEAATLPPHIVVKAADQAVFGYAELTIRAE